MKRIFLGILCLMLTLTCAISCKKEPDEVPPRDYVESEVIAEAGELLLKSNQVNRILWGVGLPASQNESSQSIGSYTEMDWETAQQMKIYCVDDIRALCKEVYSEDVCQMAERTVFSPVKDSEDNVISLVRYYDSTVEAEGEEKTVLMVNTKSTVYFERDAEYHVQTLRIKEVKGEKIYLTATVTVYNEENQSQQRELTFSVIEQRDGWRLASPTYMAYIPQ